jgi:hypothetical protein
MPQNDKALLARLNDNGVEFVVIGGVCGVLHGLSLVTFDLDVCCRFSIANLRSLAKALNDLHPFHRFTPGKLPFELSDEIATRLKNLYLQTDFGILDCLSEVSGIGQFDEVLKNSFIQATAFGNIRMLNIDALIAAKEAVGRERDLLAVKLLRAIKERK